MNQKNKECPKCGEEVPKRFSKVHELEECEQEKLPTVANLWYSHGGLKVSYIIGKEKMTENFMDKAIADVEKLVRRKDVEQLIRDSIGDYDERINNAKNIPRAWNMALEKLLEEIQE